MGIFQKIFQKYLYAFNVCWISSGKFLRQGYNNNISKSFSEPCKNIPSAFTQFEVQMLVVRRCPSGTKPLSEMCKLYSSSHQDITSSFVTKQPKKLLTQPTRGIRTEFKTDNWHFPISSLLRKGMERSHNSQTTVRLSLNSLHGFRHSTLTFTVYFANFKPHTSIFRKFRKC